ncbi:cytidylate kinase [Caloramator quimbayensis]|uniref:Cytidylate kinase n=1 Tax=Caloramator quimbayensis TaxID=1147123 RepID=A0A1T4X276_9CLOT|nr:(d)CMP kinase [Caloramator quimbayensis]SKA83185.1 cytidylate kinase [Caloramator quimbayensis]
MKNIVIAVDGPAGAGKSTISKIVAERLNIEYIDTGAMYRAITLKIIRKGIGLEDIDSIKKLLNETHIDFINGRIYLDEEDVSEDIRKIEVSSKVSDVAAMPFVRGKLVELQRNMASLKSVIMDGRDIGTNVLKDANIKIFLTASVDERAKRRYKEMIEKGNDVTFEDICRDIENRDRIDSTREVNPLKKADDAVEIDTTSKSIDDVVNEIISIVKKVGVKA